MIKWAQDYCQKITIQDLFEIETEYFIQKVTSQVEEYRMKKMTGAKIKQSDEIFDILSIEELEKRQTQMMEIDINKKKEYLFFNDKLIKITKDIRKWHKHNSKQLEEHERCKARHQSSVQECRRIDSMRIILNKEINTIKMSIKQKLHRCAIQMKSWLQRQQEEFGENIGHLMVNEDITPQRKLEWIRELMAENMTCQQSYLNDMQTLMVIQKQGLAAAQKHFEEMQKEDQVNSKNKLESLLNKISNTGSGKPSAAEDTHFDKKQRRMSQLVESKKKNIH